MRSSLWASYNGDLKALLDSTTGEFQQEMQKRFEADSADKASIQLMDEASKFKSVQVLNRDVQSDDTAVLTTALDVGDGTQTMKLVLKKVGNANIFEAAISRASAENRLIDDLLALFGGRVKPVIARLIESGKLTMDDVKDAEDTLKKLARKDKQK